jgi:hypothetical protein
VNENSLGSVKRELLEELNIECIGMAMHEEYGYQEITKTNILICLSCLAKERCIPIANFKLLDIWSKNNDFRE